MIKETMKVLFVALIAMIMLTGAASAAEIKLTDPINISNVEAVEITGTNFTVNETFSYSIINDVSNVSYVSGTGIVGANGAIFVTENVSGLTDGELLATVFEAGAVMVTDTATKDTVLPTFTIDEVTSPTNTCSQTVTGIMEEGATVEVECSTANVSAVNYQSGIWSVDISGMIEGDNVIGVFVTDTAGNGDLGSATIFVDTVPPTIVINEVTTPTNIDYQTVTGTIDDNNVTVEVECSTAATMGTVIYDDTTWSVNITGMVEGDNEITATAFDWLDNTASDTATIVLDITIPTIISVTLSDDVVQTGAKIEVNVDAVDAYGIDSVTADIISLTLTYNYYVGAITAGTSPVTVIVTDEAGNQNTGTAAYTIDNEAPSTPTITLLNPINIANVAAVTITGIGEAGAEVEYSIEDFNGEHSVDGDVFIDVNGIISVTGINVSDLADGILTASVWLTDAAGNKGAACTDIATKDTVAPTADAGSDQTIILGDTVQFNGSESYDAGDGSISYSWDFDNDSEISTVAEPSYEYDEYGVYEVTLTVTDETGNTDTDTMTVTHGIKLNAGWNLVSTPLIPDNESIENIMSDVNGAVSVWSYNADTTSWISYIPGVGGELAEITAGNGYWFDMSAADTLVIDGTYFEGGANTPPTYSVYKGWNLIGVHSISLCSAEAYFSSTSFNCAYTLHGYQDGVWVNIDMFEGDLAPGYGYWAYMTEDGALAP